MSAASGFVSAINACAATQYDSEYLGVNVERLTGLASRAAAGVVSFEDASGELCNRATIAFLSRGGRGEVLVSAVRSCAIAGYDADCKPVNLGRARAACADLTKGRFPERFLDEVKDRVLIARVG